MAAASGLRKRLRREEILRQDIDYKNPLTGCVVSRTQKRTSVRLPLLCADRLPIYRGSRLRRTQREGEGGGGCGKRENDCFARATDTRCRFSANPKSKKRHSIRERPKGRGTRNSAKQIEVVVFHPPTRFGVYAIPKRRKSTNNLWPVAPLTLLKSWSETWARPKNTKGRGDPASAFPPRTWPFRLSGFCVEANYRDSSVLSCNFREYCSAT